jgi:hypothetical protein
MDGTKLVSHGKIATLSQQNNCAAIALIHFMPFCKALQVLAAKEVRKEVFVFSLLILFTIIKNNSELQCKVKA